MHKASSTVQITLDLKGIFLVGLVIALIHWLYPKQSSITINNYGGNTYNTYNVSYASPAQGLPSFNEAAKVTRTATESENDEDSLCYGAKCNNKASDSDTREETEETSNQSDESTEETPGEVGAPEPSNTKSQIVIDGSQEVIDETDVETNPVVNPPVVDTTVSEDDLIPEVIDPDDGKLRAKVVVNLKIK